MKKITPRINREIIDKIQSQYCMQGMLINHIKPAQRPGYIAPQNYSPTRFNSMAIQAADNANETKQAIDTLNK